jgi:WD40-like Beta Propeller Repeat
MAKYAVLDRVSGPTASAGSPTDPPSWQPTGQGPPGWPGSPAGPYSSPTPPTQPYGAGGSGGSGAGRPPDSGGSEPGPFGSGRVVLIIVGMVVLIGGVIAGAFFITRGSGGQGGSTPSPSASSSYSASSPSSPSSNTPSESASTPQDGQLPTAAAIPGNVAAMSMREQGESDRWIYLIDTEDKIKPAQLNTVPGTNHNPMMSSARDTIAYLNAGVLRVMASDGSGDRRLFDRAAGGCDDVTHASWSQRDPNLMVATCRVSQDRDTMLVIGAGGQLVRRLDAGKNHIGDVSLSPDGQTVAFWATNETNAAGGALYTMPLIGTGDPKRVADTEEGVNTDPAWSPDGDQIAFSRQLHDGSNQGNKEIFVMNVDGSDERQVTDSEATDIRPSWSPDGKNLLIVSNRRSAGGGPGNAFGLALIRISDREVIGWIDLDARVIGRPFWTTR